jgi:glucokinase
MGIVEMAINVCQALNHKDQTPFSKFVINESSNITSKTIFDYIKKKDPVALEVNEQVCDKLARIVGVIINSFAPERIVLGGGVMNAGKIIIDTTWKNVSKYSLTTSRKNCKLVLAKCGEHAGVIGAAQLVFENKF